MATEPILASFDLVAVQCGYSVRSSVFSDSWTLTKPEVDFLIAMALNVTYCSESAS